MSTLKYPHLFEPIRIGRKIFKNRIFAAPNGCQYLDHGNVPSDAGIAFYERKALGGFAAVTLGECIVDSKTGQAHAYQILLDNPHSDAALALNGCAPEFYMVGDCTEARNILSATTEAYNAGRDIGRI